jgi:hypothetical protein
MEQNIEGSTEASGVRRAGGFCAIAGGTLRFADSFAASVAPPHILAILYFATDILLLAGVAGLWWRRRANLGIAGTAGFAIFVIGILGVRVSALGLMGKDGYLLAAGVSLLGLALNATETLIKRSAALWSPVLWLASLGCAIAVVAGVAPEVMTIASGVAFGAGFIAAGSEALAV